MANLRALMAHSVELGKAVRERTPSQSVKTELKTLIRAATHSPSIVKTPKRVGSPGMNSGVMRALAHLSTSLKSLPGSVDLKSLRASLERAALTGAVRPLTRPKPRLTASRQANEHAAYAARHADLARDPRVPAGVRTLHRQAAKAHANFVVVHARHAKARK